MSTPTTLPQFYVVTGVFLACSVVTAALRTGIRVRRFGTLDADDWFLIIGTVSLIAGTVLCWVSVSFDRYEERIVAGEAPAPSDFDQQRNRGQAFWRAEIPLLTVAIFSVKYSFLFFFYRIINRTKRWYMIWWWFIFIIVAASSPVVLYITATSCPYGGEHIAICSTDRLTKLIIAGTVLDISTDVFIISIPVIVLWNVRFGIKRKLGMASLLCLSIFMIACSIARGVRPPLADGDFDILWIKMWNHLEGAIGIICVSANAFPSLFRNSNDDPTPPPPPGTETRRNRYEARQHNRLGLGTQDSTMISYPSRMLRFGTPFGGGSTNNNNSRRTGNRTDFETESMAMVSATDSDKRSSQHYSSKPVSEEA